MIDSSDTNRRKAIIPTPNRPILKQQPFISNTTNDELVSIVEHNSTIHTLQDDTLTNNVSGVISKAITSNTKSDDMNRHTDYQSQLETVDETHDFDAFISENFAAFSGNQNVHRWLDETEQKFKEFKISRNLRFQAIALLVEGEAKRKYIKVRKEIHSFDDFYEFLLLHFDADEKSVLSTDNSRLIHQPATLRSTSSVSFGATNLIGELPDNKLMSNTIDSSTFVLDETINDLRKAIVSDLIKNPKIFKGGKDDVNKWIDDIEHLLDVAHIPESSRLDLISYSLRGDALQWFKTSKSLFTSWKVFTRELKRAFTSSFHAELAFKKLESYNQGENQSIRNFFNEILKLCNEADATMSEATKLKNLLNKTKPTIQFEVRKKKPTTPTEFLEYAKDIEELFQLSNINNEDMKISNDENHKEPLLPSSSTVPLYNNTYRNISSTTQSSPKYYKYNNYQNSNNTFVNPHSRNNYQPPSRMPPFLYNQSRNMNQQYSSNRNNSSFNTANNNRIRPQSNQMNYSNNNQSRLRTANTVFSLDPSNNAEVEPEEFSISSTPCIRYGDNSKNIPKNPSKSPLIFITTLVNNYQTKILIDTGATTTFIREDVLQHMTHLQYIRKTPYSFTLADGLAPFHVLGVVEVSIRFGNSTTKVHAHIARKLCATMIIGMNYINKYNLNINIAQQTISIIHNNHVSSMNMDTDFELHRIPANISKPIQIPPRSNRSAQVSIPISSISSPFVPNPFVRNTYALSTPYTFLNFLNYYSDIKLFNMSSHRQYLNEGTCIGFLTYRKKSIIGEKPDSTTHKSFEVAGTSGLTSAPNDSCVYELFLVNHLELPDRP
ncbi:unnamed protein product, partial [Rotaria magnacalcarata]